MASSLDPNFRHFVDSIRKREKQSDGACLDLFRSSSANDDNEEESSSTSTNDIDDDASCQARTVRVFLSHLDGGEAHRLHNSEWAEQINALPKATELQIHVSLDRRQTENSETTTITRGKSDTTTIFQAIESIVTTVRTIKAVKLVLYAKDQWPSRHGEEEDDTEDDNVTPPKDPTSTFHGCNNSSIETLQIVLVTSSIFTSFAPSYGDVLPTLARRLILRLLQTTTPALPKLQRLSLVCDKSQCWAVETNYAAPPAMDHEWLEAIEKELQCAGGTCGSGSIFRNTAIAAADIVTTRPLSLEIKGWKLDWATMRGICSILRALPNDEDHHPKHAAAAAASRTLEALTMSQCRWALELRNSEAKNMRDPSCDLVKALADNITLRTLALNLSMIPSQIFSWKHLANAFNVHPKLQSFQTTVCMKEQAFASLLKAYHQSSLQEITIPFFFGTWTDDLLILLRNVLFKNQASLKKILLRLQHVPARWATDRPPSHRSNFWSLWKEYLLSTTSDSLHHLAVKSLTPEEKLDLVSILQRRRRPLQSLSLYGCTSLPTIVDLTDRLASHNITRALPAHFDFQVWNGDEIDAAETLMALSQAMKQQYGILTMNITCAEYSATPHANILKELYQGSEAVAGIQAMLALNNAGRRHMLQNPQCLVVGTHILAQVAQQNSVDAIFHHVMEHPALVLSGASS